MIRLNPTNINSKENNDKVFLERWRGQVHYVDYPRFQRLAKYFKDGKYLDIGCFNSPMPYELAQDNHFKREVYAIDHAPITIETLKEKFPEVNYLCQDFTQLPFEDESMDYVVAGEVIEHLENPKEFIKEAVRALKKGGYFALSTPYKERADALISREHVWSFDDTDILNLLKEYGQVEITHYQDTTQIIIAYLKKQ